MILKLSTLQHHFLDNSPILQHHLYRSGESGLFLELLYHTLEVDNHFNLPLKN